MDSVRSHVQPASSRLPIELLQGIYHLLSPPDFDAARHTCRWWFLASLDESLLTSQLISGGWRAAALQDLQEATDYYLGRRSCPSSRTSASGATPAVVCQKANVSWILSKRLAAETTLCPEWRCVWPSSPYDGSQISHGHIDVRAIITPTTHISALRGGSSPIPQAIFTVSGCSKFVLLAQDRVVFIYSLENISAGIRPLTSIFCHRRIVNVSMDTSCGRYAVAVLLEGRIGMCCEVKIDEKNPPGRNRIHPSMSLSDFRNVDVCTTSRPRPCDVERNQYDSTLHPTTRPQFAHRRESHQRRGHAVGRSADATFIGQNSFSLTDSKFHSGRGEAFNPPIANVFVPQSFPEGCLDDHANGILLAKGAGNNFDPITGTLVSFELGPRRVYKNLCSIQDPPRSVAICPQRQCVAFGCKTGVELHWIDASRGSTLSRWFPLAAPSDHLYFVPPRHGEQSFSDTRLRLISSAGGQEEFVDADHYRAEPLSDGHLLYTDPGNGHVYLGSDKPGGPTKLRREVVCLPPKDHPPGKAPSCYAAGYEMRWGVRIVVAYGRIIMLYNLPPDDFERARPTTPGFQVAQSDLAMDVAVSESHRSARRLQGVQIHDLGHDGCVVHDIAVDTRRGRLKVWLFLRNLDHNPNPEARPSMHFASSSSPSSLSSSPSSPFPPPPRPRPRHHILSFHYP